MAQIPSLNLDADDDPTLSATYRRLGTINGLLIGLTVGLGTWGVEALQMARLPLPRYLPALFLGIALVTIFGGAVGWLTARIARGAVSAILWILTAVLYMFVIGYLPYQGRTLIGWLADTRFWGKPLYPSILEGTSTGLILGGLLLILTLGLLGLLQGYRLENMIAETGRTRVLNGRIWLSLLLPLPFVFLASTVTQSVIANPVPLALEQTHRAVLAARLIEGDLRDAGEVDGINLVALRGLEGRLSGDYTLGITEVNPLNSTVVITVDFENGTWVYCRVINDQLSFCYDAEPAYLSTLQSLLAGSPLPDPCRGCDLEAAGSWGQWFADRREQLGNESLIERLAQQGSHALFRITGESDAAVECWFAGVSPVQLVGCQEVGRE